MLKLIQLTQYAYASGAELRDHFYLIDTDEKLYKHLGIHSPPMAFLKELVPALDKCIGFKHQEIQVSESEFYKLLTELEYKNVTP